MLPDALQIKERVYIYTKAYIVIRLLTKKKEIKFEIGFFDFGTLVMIRITSTLAVGLWTPDLILQSVGMLFTHQLHPPLPFFLFYLS